MKAEVGGLNEAQPKPAPDTSSSHLSGHGSRMPNDREAEWSRSSLGPADQWSPALRVAAGLVAHSTQPMFLWWGPDFIHFHNAAFAERFDAGLLPRLGAAASAAWPAFWKIAAPAARRVLESGEGTDVGGTGPAAEPDSGTFGTPVSLSPVFDEGGAVAGLIGIASSGASHVAHEASVEKAPESSSAGVGSASLLQLAADALPALIAYVDAEGRYKFNNRSYETWFAQPREEIKGKTLAQVVGMQAYEALRPHVEAALSGKRVTFEATVPYAGGGTREVEAEYIPHRGEDGNVQGFFALIHDITQRKRREQELSYAFDAAQMATWDCDHVTGKFHAPAQLNQLYGYPKDFPLDLEAVRALHHPGDKDRLERLRERQVSDGTVTDVEREFRIVRPDGNMRWIFARGEIIRGADGRALRSIGVAMDVTRLKEAERALRERTEQLEAVLETAPAGVWFTRDPEARRATGNRQAAEMFRTSENVNLSLSAPIDERPPVIVLRNGKELPPEELPLQRAARGEQVVEEELEFRYPNGDSMTVILRAQTLRDGAGRPAGAVAAAVDISGRKLAEDALRESESRFREMADNSPMMVWVADPDDQLTFMSRSWEEFTGQPVEEALGRGWLDRIHPDDKERVDQASSESAPRPVRFREEYRLRHRSGEWRWAIDAAAPRFDASGAFLGHIGSVVDISDRMEAERSLREREERLRLIVDSAREYAIFTLDPTGRITSWNSGAERILGYSEEDVVGRSGDIFFTPDDRAANAPETERKTAAEAGRASNERWHMRKDGSRFWGSGVMVPLASGSEPGFLKIFRDRTSERVAEEMLTVATERARALAAERAAVLGQLAEGVIVTDPEGRITFVNEAAERLHGGAKLDVPPEEYADVFHLFTEDGRPYPPDELPLARAVLKGETVSDSRWRIRRPDGAEVLAIGNASPVRAEDGGVIGTVLTLRDDTAREAAERELREADLRKNIALGAGKMGVWDWDIAQDRLVWDAAEFALYGADPETFIPTNAGFESFIHPDDLERFRSAAREALSKREALDAEFRIIRSDGQERWISERAVLIAGPDGEPARMVGVSFDITDRKKADQRRTLLINELNHRVKNTLATVQSIASQTLKNSDAGKAVREAFEMRLVSLSKTHDVLTQQNWEGARLGEIVCNSLRPFEDGGKERIAASGPEIQLLPKAALALSMALHELATNAVKYGALSTDEGSIAVRWALLDHRMGERVVSIMWRERGGPAVQPPQRKGFGTRLIERSLAGELGGEVEMRYLPSGVVCRIEAPLSNIAG